ncbi:hypothetical protein ACFYXS_36100 [Streptomyces sp. NPDC002574]|uniref:hypothetical protein n=1 Tax=Streptomyces sp. NPDC002574 TaxID=3364652 RepID=UPI0036930FE0
MAVGAGMVIVHTRANLAEHGIDEPVHWEPPRDWVTEVDWPGVEPDALGRAAFRDTISTCKTTAEAAAAQGMTHEHVRLFTALSGITAPAEAALASFTSMGSVSPPDWAAVADLEARECS